MGTKRVHFSAEARWKQRNIGTGGTVIHWRISFFVRGDELAHVCDLGKYEKQMKNR